MASLLLPVWLVGVADDETEVGVSGEDVKVGGWVEWDVRAVGKSCDNTKQSAHIVQHTHVDTRKMCIAHYHTRAI